MIFAVFLCVACVNALWPIPSTYTSADQVLWIDPDVRITYNMPAQGYNHSTASSAWSNAIINNAIERTYDTLFYKNFVPWKFHPRFSSFEPKYSGDNATYITSVALHQNASDIANIEKPTSALDESYTLDVSADGKVIISAKSSIGLLYGLTTFTQLFYRHTRGFVYTSLAPVHIEDKPKFQWRGLNIDTSRTFKPVHDMFRMIDAMAFNKMNRLHWHVTDAQAWPLVIPSMPELAEKGAYIAYEVYSPQDVKALQEYGALNGVTVVMEFDNPGHTSSIWFSHPELIAAFNVQPDWNNFAAEPPAGTLKLNSTAVSHFLQDMFADLLPRLWPLSSYFHLGGDEVNANAYTLDDTVGTNDTTVLQPLMQKYMDRNMKQVTAEGFAPLVWEEMLLQWNLTLPRNTIVQTWQSDDALLAVVKAGYRALAGNYNYWYLDCGQGQWLNFHQDTAAGYWPFEDYCSPRKNWRLMYSYDPLSGIPANLTHLVLGGEAHIWSEQTDAINLDSMIWPRAAAAAEVLWSGAKDPVTGQNRSQITASPRLSEMRERLVARGVRAEPHPNAVLHHERDAVRVMRKGAMGACFTNRCFMTYEFTKHNSYVSSQHELLRETCSLEDNDIMIFLSLQSHAQSDFGPVVGYTLRSFACEHSNNSSDSCRNSRRDQCNA
nr:beta-hexosaminidase [Quercus suber]